MPDILSKLRYRIAIGPFLVVAVGVAIMMLMLVLLLNTAADILHPVLVELAASTGDPNALIAAETTLLAAFRNAVTLSVVIAAVVALITGLTISYFLYREIIRPINALVRSSRRIASGRYDERIALPRSEELVAVADSFNQMAASLMATEQERITLIGNVTHELRTPLTGLEGYLEGLIDGVFPGEPETYAQMFHETRRLRRLVDDIQALSRVEAGAIALNLQPFDMLPVLQRVVAHLQPQAEGSDLALRISGPCPDALWVHADADRTAQVLTNLLGNAIRYTPSGGEIDVCVSAEIEEKSAVIGVTDNGIGIPADALPYVFERFYRVDRSRSRQSGGSGIGLTISRHLAWAMGGDLTASSPGTNQGATFSFRVPLATDRQ